MNTDGVRVPVEDLRRLVFAIYRSLPIPEDHTRLVTDLLIDTELRGVVSHGMLNVERYVRSWQEGLMNPHPQIRLLREGPATAALSGDGGLGMIVAAQAMGMAIRQGPAGRRRRGHYPKTGVPISRQAMDSLQRLAGEFHLDLPWA